MGYVRYRPRMFGTKAEFFHLDQRCGEQPNIFSNHAGTRSCEVKKDAQGTESQGCAGRNGSVIESFIVSEGRSNAIGTVTV